MLEGQGIEDDDGGSYYIHSNVGDDEGKKEYPFITSPRVLAAMRKLYDFHKKQLVHDFINCAGDYEHCPKGSYLSRECKPSIPGPYYSCPILHESGDDVLNLPIPRRSPRPKTQQAFMRKPKKRASCRKCSLVTFNHYDASMYHENYLKECTYAKLRTTTNAASTPWFYAQNSTDELIPNATSSEQKFSDHNHDDEGSSTTHPKNDSCYPPQWSELKEFMDPAVKPVKKRKDKKINCNNHRNKTGKSSAATHTTTTTKPSMVASRYRETPKRKCRPNMNAMHVKQMQVSNSVTKVNQSQRQRGDSEQANKIFNPFPMPDVFEEIYFGHMPESINTLPVPLQNFKKIQMKVAGQNNCTPRASLESHKNVASDVFKTSSLSSSTIFHGDVYHK